MRNFTDIMKRIGLSLTAALIAFPSLGEQAGEEIRLPDMSNSRKAAPYNAPQSDDESTVYGYLYYSPTGEQSGFYNLNPLTGTGNLRWVDFYTDWGMVMTNGWLRDGRVCGINNFTFMGGVLSYNYVELDIENGDVVDLIPLSVNLNDLRNVYFTMAYRDLDDMVYGYGYSNDGESVSFNRAPSRDIDSSVSVKIVEEKDLCTALCYNVQDDLFYGVNTEGWFVSVDHEGNQTLLFDLAVPDYRDVVTGIVYNPDENTYTWNVFLTTGHSAMYSIDPVARKATKLSDCAHDEEYIFMVNTKPNAAPKAPAQPEIKEVAFEKASNAGTVTAVLPTLAQDGSTLARTLGWQLFIDGELADSGTGEPGTTVTARVSDTPDALHVFAFMASDDGLRSLPAITKQWVGADYPAVPANVALVAEVVSWDAVTEGVHGGYVDTDNLTYTVYLNDEEIGTTSSTSISFQFPDGSPYQTYHAYVVADAGGKSSERGVSNPLNFGHPLLINPSIHYRPEEWELPLFTTLNVDGKKDSQGNDLTWRYTEEMAFPSFASGYDGDDWLFFPPMLFDNAEKAYRFVMEAGLVHDSDTRGRISVYIGKEPTPEAMTQTILAPHQCEHMRGDDILEYFAVNEPGVYYIGIHAVTYNVSFHISDMDIAITDRTAEVPVAVSDLVATAAPDGELKATVEFRMPELTSNGKEIAADANLVATVSAYTRTTGSFEPGELVEARTVKGKPGQLMKVEVATAQNDNLIVVACAIDGKYGAERSLPLYTGVVRPYIVQNLKAEVTEDNMGMRLTWTPPVEGEEEGAIGNTFYYTVWYYNDSWEFGDHVGWDITEYTYRLKPGAEQQWVRLGIMALNDAGQSYHITGVTEVIGTPYTLPIIETFPDYYEEYEPIMVQRPTAEYENTYWYVDDPADILSPAFANESGVAYIGFVSSEGKDQPVTNAKSRLSLPKFTTRGLDGVTFTLDYFGGLQGKYAAQFHILADSYGMAPVNISDPEKGEGWISASVNLPVEFLDKDWVELLIDADYADDQEFAMFCSYSLTTGSGVGEIASGSDGKVLAGRGMIHVIGFKGLPLLISDLNGRVVASRDALDDQNGFAVAPGVYVVKVGAHSAKVIVK